MIRIAVLSLSLLTFMSGAAVAPAVADIIVYFPRCFTPSRKDGTHHTGFNHYPGGVDYRNNEQESFPKAASIRRNMVLYRSWHRRGLSHSIPFLLSMRAVLGIGVGILMPLSTCIISDLWSGYEKKTKIIGLASASNNLGGIIATLLSGLLAAISWRASFLIYLLGIPVLILVLFFMPEQQPKQTQDKQTGQGTVSLGFYIMWGLGMFLLMVAFYTVPVNIALYIQENHLGNSRMAGLAMAVLTASSFLTGLVFGRLDKSINIWLPGLSLCIFALSFYGITAFLSLIPLFVCLILNGIGLGILVPLIMNGVTRKDRTHIRNSGYFGGHCFSFCRAAFQSHDCRRDVCSLLRTWYIQYLFDFFLLCRNGNSICDTI
jgi:MFS family permease